MLRKEFGREVECLVQGETKTPSCAGARRAPLQHAETIRKMLFAMVKDRPGDPHQAGGQATGATTGNASRSFSTNNSNARSKVSSA